MAKKMPPAESESPQIIPDVTDSALFGGRKQQPAKKAGCLVCGAPKRVFKHAWGLTTNINAVLHACGDCLVRGWA